MISLPLCSLIKWGFDWNIMKESWNECLYFVQENISLLHKLSLVSGKQGVVKIRKYKNWRYLRSDISSAKYKEILESWAIPPYMIGFQFLTFPEYKIINIK